MSINQYTMNSLLDNQHIRRRRSSGSVLRPREPKARRVQSAGSGGEQSRARRSGGKAVPPKTAFRPEGIMFLFRQNSRIMDNIKQNPVRVSRGRSSHGRNSWSGETGFTFSSIGNFFLRNSGKDRENTYETGIPDYSRERSDKERAFPVFTIPAIPVTAFFILALGIFFVIYSSGGTLDWMGREVVNTEKDPGSQYNLALYAGVIPMEVSQSAGEEIPLDLTETFAWQAYTVKRGDSVSKIAVDFSVSMDAIIASNGITNARSLREGEVLRIPNMDGIPYTVKRGDSLSGISKSMGVPQEAILDANDIQSDIINAGVTLFIPGARMNRDDLKMALGDMLIHPVNGAKLSSPFGWRNDPFTGVRSHHAAIDLSAPQGTPIKAAMDGKVSALGYNATYGNFIILTHSGGLQTMYAHLHTILVKKDDTVRQGAHIGNVGSTGYSTGPHLHFAVFKNGRAVNPLDFLNART